MVNGFKFNHLTPSDQYLDLDMTMREEFFWLREGEGEGDRCRR